MEDDIEAISMRIWLDTNTLFELSTTQKLNMEQLKSIASAIGLLQSVITLKEVENDK